MTQNMAAKQSVREGNPLALLGDGTPSQKNEHLFNLLHRMCVRFIA